MSCGELAMPIPAIMLVVGIVALTIVVARRERLAIKDALLVLIGLRRYETPRGIALLMMATLLLPIGTWVLLNERCLASLPAL